MRHWAEEVARRHLTAQGWRCLAANALVRGGEIDLVMHDGRALVFVEVRQRRTDRFGSPAESLDGRKRARLRRSARLWTQAHGGDRPVPMRIDAVLILGDRRRHRVEHLEDVA